MKLSYLANARMPSEKAHPYQIMKMCEAFSKKLEVNLILPFRVQTPRMRGVKNIWEYYGIDGKFRIKKLPSIDFLWIDIYLNVPQMLQTLIFRTQAISFAIFAAFYSFFKKADIYYTRDRFFAFLFTILNFSDRRKIYHETHKFEPSVSRLMKKGKIDGLIAIAHKLEETYTKEGIPSEKILVAPAGVDLEKFGTFARAEARKELRIPLDKKVIGYTGHLYDWKGVYVLARGMEYLPNDCVSYFIGGTEKDLARFREFIKKNEIPNVVVVGYVPPLIVPKYLAASDVVVLPNIKKGDSEYTSPLKLFEYMASKRPVVASDLPSIREILRDEENAILVEPGSPGALAEGIRRVLEDKELAAKIAENAYRDARQYTWEKRAERILKFMGGSIDQKRSRIF